MAKNKNQVILLNSITDAGANAEEKIVLCGSHGGLYPAWLASIAKVKAVIFNDAGKGLENAGIAGVMALGDVGIAAAAVSHSSCRIGDAKDMRLRGTISVANSLGKDLGIVCGEKSVTALEKLKNANYQTQKLGVVKEGRQIRSSLSGMNIVLVDSASLVGDEDDGQIIITGSHGGLISSDPQRALKADAALAVFNDAGIGCEEAGIERLNVLQHRGVPAITVSHMTARIGDADSALRTGEVSAFNGQAEKLGIVLKQPIMNTVEQIVGAKIPSATQALE